MKSLRSNFLWTLAGNGIYGGCQWAMLLVLARLGDPKMVGTYALAQAVTSPIILFSNPLRSLQATDTNERFSFGQYRALRIGALAVSLLVIAGIVLVSHYPPEIAAVTLIVGVAKAIESMSDVYFGLLQHHEDMSRIAKSLMIKGVISLSVLATAITVTHSIVAGCCGILLAWVTVFAAYDRRATSVFPQSSDRKDWDRVSLMRLVRLWMPLGVTMMLISLNANIPRYFLEHYAGTRSLGIFSALAALQTAGFLVVMALGNSAAPRMARYYNLGAFDRFRKLTAQLFAICTGMGLAAVLVVSVGGNALARFLFGKEYAGQNGTFLWIAVFAAVSYSSSVMGYAATASNRIRFQPWVYAAVTLVTTLGCWFAVPRAGGLGAAIVMSLAAGVGLFFYSWSFLASLRERGGRADTPTLSDEHHAEVA